MIIDKYFYVNFYIRFSYRYPHNNGSLEPLGTFLPVGIETLGYLLPQPGVINYVIEKKLLSE